MDDFNIEDPRKTSAKQIKITIEKNKGHKTILQYLFDLCIKTLLCISLIVFDFTLFANAGNYQLFFQDTILNPEILYIFIGICAVVFILMFIASFITRLDNLIVAATFSVTFIAIINQFATFDKHSGLLILFGGIFSDKINAILYEYSLWIIFALTLLLIFYTFNKIKRQYIFYITFVSCAMAGWVISEAYFNNEVQYFKNIETNKNNIPSSDNDENFIYLAFNNLGSPNNLLNMRDTIKGSSNLEDAFYNTIGFYQKNNFTLYPNVVSFDSVSPFVNVAASLNPEYEGKTEDLLLNNASKKSYFDFSSLQENKFHLKKSSIIEKFNDNNFKIKTYQTKDIDLCQLKKGIDNFTCDEKISIPTILPSELSTAEKTKILLSQWLSSTGLLPSVNPVLNALNFVWDSNFTKPLNFSPSELHAVNSLQIFDIITSDIENIRGKKAYFAAIDFPSRTYIYDDYCNIKPLSEWSGEDLVSGSGISLSKRQQAYAQQINCLIGSLENFIQNLKEKQQLENTTIIIEGLNNPSGISPKYKTMYQNLQAQKQVLLAIHKAGKQSSLIDYSFCPVNSMLAHHIFDKDYCSDLSHLQLSEIETKEVLSESEFQKYNSQKTSNAMSKFDSWFVIWKSHRNTPANNDVSAQDEEETLSLENNKEITKAPITDNIIEDIPEEKLKNISAAIDETENGSNEGTQEESVSKQEDTSVDEQSTTETPEESVQDNTETSTEDTIETLQINNANDNTPEEDEVVKEDQQDQPATPQITVSDLEKELENIAAQKGENTETPSPTEEKIQEDVVPETLFDEDSSQDKIEASINKAKEMIKEKEQAVLETQNYQPEEPIQSEEMRNILKASESVEETIEETVINEETSDAASKDINIQVKIVEN